ncbi:MAG: TonB-dependent receptor [Acidobacteriota bacterium]
MISDRQSGTALKGALVEIINQQTGVVITLRTDYRGRFYQGLLIPGIYRIRVSTTGYQTKEVVQRLKITYTGEVVPVPVALDPAPAIPPPVAAATPAPAVADTDIRASIITVDGRRSGSFAEEEVTTLPLGGTTFVRTFDELALLLPGVAPPPQTLGSVAGPGVGSGVGSAGQFAVNGLRSRGNNFTVDGSDNNDEDIGVRRQGFLALIPQPIESVQEYQVITLLAPAQFGRNIGGQVNAVSKSGGSKIHGTVYGTFNSSQLNARNFFDTNFGNATSTLRANNQDVLVQTRSFLGTVLSQQPLTVRNQSGGKDSFTLGQVGFVLGGPLVKGKTFYFVSLESEFINATREESFAVPTIEQRGAFGTGATGIFQNPFTGLPTQTIPTSVNGAAVLSLYPFPNNPNGPYGPNTLTQVLPASGKSTVLSGKIDHNFNIHQREQSITGRYNFTNDWREIPATGGAIFSTLKPRVRTQNFSFFLNSKLSGPNSTNSIFNQVRLSYGRTRLRFEEVRDTTFLLPSNRFPNVPFFLNAPELLNLTQPPTPGTPNTGPVIYVRQAITVEGEIGPLGQVVVAGFSPLGVDVFNFPQRRVNNTYQLADQLTLRVNDHGMTFGSDNRRTELNSELPRNSRPQATFNGAPRVIFTNNIPRFPTAADLNPIVRAIDLAAIDAPNNLFLTLSTGGPDSINLRFYQINFYGQDEWRLRKNLSLSFGLRYEYNTPPKEAHRLIENTFSDPLLNQVPGLATFIQGRNAINDRDGNNLAPRIGLAYAPNLFGPNRATVLRGGYGVFYDQILGAVVSQSRNVFPSFFTLNFGGGAFTTLANDFPLVLFNPVTSAFGNQQIPIVLPGTINRLNPQLPLTTFLAGVQTTFPNAVSPTLPARRLQMPMAQHYAFTFEQQLQSDLVVSVAFAGTKGANLLRFTTPNLGAALNLIPTALQVIAQPFPAPFFRGRSISPARPINGIGGLSIFETTGSSRYESLQLQVRGRFRHSVQYQAAYTLSKATDDVSDVFDLAGAFALPQNSLTFAGEQGPANFDARHRFSYNFIYTVPSLQGRSRLVRLLFSDMQVAGTGQFQTGQPFTVNSTIDVNLDGNLTDRLDNTNGLVVTGDGRQPLVLNTNNPLSLLAAFGQDGRIDRNTFRAGSLLNLNLAILKNVTLSSSQRLGLRVELFNFINRANFGVPVRILEAPAFGRAINTVTPGRRIQFSMKYSF